MAKSIILSIIISGVRLRGSHTRSRPSKTTLAQMSALSSELLGLTYRGLFLEPVRTGSQRTFVYHYFLQILIGHLEYKTSFLIGSERDAGNSRRANKGGGTNSSKRCHFFVDCGSTAALRLLRLPQSLRKWAGRDTVENCPEHPH
jgi:hypothetical protein